MPISIRAYLPDDEPSWLRCRVLSFLDTSYYDDVRPRRPPAPAIPLVAIDGAAVVGILDLEVDGPLATIDTLAVHPDHRHRGIGSRLLDRALAALPESVTTLDAWTRDDAPALAWYRSHGFAESDHYLHVHKGWDEPDDGWASPDGLSSPVTAFCHGVIEDEARMRARFSRVHVCRRFRREVAAG